MNPWHRQESGCFFSLLKRKCDGRVSTTLKKRIYPQSMIQSAALDRSCSLAPLPQYYHRLVADSLRASKRMTSPGQAVIFQTVGEGDLPFTSAVTEDSSTPVFLFLGREDKTFQEHISLLTQKVDTCLRWKPFLPVTSDPESLTAANHALCEVN